MAPSLANPMYVMRENGSAPADEGIEGETIWIHEDSRGLEIQRGVFDGELPEVGAELSRSSVDGRPWLVHAVERKGRRTALHLRKGGEPDRSPLVRHHITVPPAGG